MYTRYVKRLRGDAYITCFTGSKSGSNIHIPVRLQSNTPHSLVFVHSNLMYFPCPDIDTGLTGKESGLKYLALHLRANKSTNTPLDARLHAANLQVLFSRGEGLWNTYQQRNFLIMCVHMCGMVYLAYWACSQSTYRRRAHQSSNYI